MSSDIFIPIVNVRMMRREHIDKMTCANLRRLLGFDLACFVEWKPWGGSNSPFVLIAEGDKVNTAYLASIRGRGGEGVIVRFALDGAKLRAGVPYICVTLGAQTDSIAQVLAPALAAAICELQTVTFDDGGHWIKNSPASHERLLSELESKQQYSKETEALRAFEARRKQTCAYL